MLAILVTTVVILLETFLGYRFFQTLEPLYILSWFVVFALYIVAIADGRLD